MWVSRVSGSHFQLKHRSSNWFPKPAHTFFNHLVINLPLTSPSVPSDSERYTDFSLLPVMWEDCSQGSLAFLRSIPSSQQQRAGTCLRSPFALSSSGWSSRLSPANDSNKSQKPGWWENNIWSKILQNLQLGCHEGQGWSESFRFNFQQCVQRMNMRLREVQ